MNTPFSLLRLSDLTMGREKAFASEYTPEIQANLLKLCTIVNAFLMDLGVKNRTVVSSGWRPATINNSTQNASKRSNHMKGLAIDIMDDKSQSLACSILARLDLLKLHGLYLEDPKSTIGKHTNWVHLQCVPPASGKHIFKP